MPALIAGPVSNWAGALATIAAMALSRNLGVSIGAGVATVWAVSLVG
jgi:branched-subunit amino acid transport protein